MPFGETSHGTPAAAAATLRAIRYRAVLRGRAFCPIQGLYRAAHCIPAGTRAGGLPAGAVLAGARTGGPAWSRYGAPMRP